MSDTRKYATSVAFRQALEARLLDIARREQTDLQRLRRSVAFDRFLQRLFTAEDTPWLLKGGYAIELRIASARATKDVDLCLCGGVREDAEETDGDRVLSMLQDAVALDVDDFFEFRIGTAMMDLEGAPYGGARYPVESRLDGRTFTRFHVDVGIGDAVVGEPQVVTPRNWLGFVGIPSPMFRAIPVEQQFAEKYHAYTARDESRPNSRVRDLVDMVLMIQRMRMRFDRVTESLRATFARRGSHALLPEVPAPPASWARPYESLAEEAGVTTDVGEALGILREFIELLPGLSA